MTRATRDVAVAVLTAAILTGLYFVLTRTPPGGVAGNIPRAADGKPLLDGIWQANNTAHYDLEAHPPRPAVATVKDRVTDVPALPVLALGAFGAVPAGLGVVEGGTIPYTPDGLKTKQENYEHALTRDPAGHRGRSRASKKSGAASREGRGARVRATIQVARGLLPRHSVTSNPCCCRSCNTDSSSRSGP